MREVRIVVFDRHAAEISSEAMGNILSRAHPGVI
jgi:hypothetical protein